MNLEKFALTLGVFLFMLGLLGSEAQAQGQTAATANMTAPAVGGDGKAEFSYGATGSGFPAGTTCTVTVTVTVDPAGALPEKEVTTHKPSTPVTGGTADAGGGGSASHPSTVASGDVWTVTVTIKCTRPDGTTSTTTTSNSATTP